MLYLGLYCLLMVIVLFAVGHKAVVKRSNDTVVSNDVPFFNEAPAKRDIVGVMLYVPNGKVDDVPSQPDLREQYRIWIENARRLDESYSRKRPLHIRKVA